MLNSFNCVALCCLAIAVTVIASGHQQDKSPARYLKAYQIDQHDLKVYKYIGAQFDGKQLIKPDEVREFFMRIMGQVDRKLDVNQLILAETVDNLLKLADGKPDCDNLVAGYYIKVVENIFGDIDVMNANRGWSKPDHDVGLFNYLQHYGRKKFDACSTNLMHDYEEALPEVVKSIEPDFDKLVASQVNDGQLSDSRLAQVASKIDLIKGGFNAKKMLQVAKENYEAQISSPSFLLYSFISNNCLGLSYRLGKVLDVYNLNRLLNPSSGAATSAPEKLLKFNEYTALCVPFKPRNDKDKIQAIIKNELSNIVFKLAKKCTGSGCFSK